MVTRGDGIEVYQTEKNKAMKKTSKLRIIPSLIFIGLIFLMGCHRSEPEPEPSPQIVLEDGPLPSSEIILNHMSCGWQNILYDNSAVLINDTTGWIHYADCDYDLPIINFDRNSVVLLSGRLAGDGHITNVSFECVGGVVNVNLYYSEGIAAVAGTPFCKAYKLPKIPEGTNLLFEIHQQ